MLWSDTDINHGLRRGEIAIDGLRDGAIQPASVDLHLSNRPFKVWDDHHPHENSFLGGSFPLRGRGHIVPWVDQSGIMIEKKAEPPEGETTPLFTLKPGQFALASTVERVKISNKVAGRLEGKSSLARLGLVIHTTAGFFDPGFEGYPTLELVNMAPYPMLLFPGMPIAQMSFFAMVSAATVSYDQRGKYHQQGADPAPSQYHKNSPSQYHDGKGVVADE